MTYFQAAVGGSVWHRYESPANHGRLMLSILLAIVLHVLLVRFLPLPKVDSVGFSGPSLEVRLVPTLPPRQPNRIPISTQETQPTTAYFAGGVSPEQPRKNRSETTHYPANPVPSELTTPTPPTPSISTESLFDSARNIIRDEAHRAQQSKDEDSVDIRDRPVLPELAKALKKPEAGETRLANGVVKIVTRSGSSYCLKPLPDIVARGGPAEPAVVPTNCP